MENIIVWIVVSISLVYIVLRIRAVFFRKPEDPCACGCAGCGAASGCNGRVDMPEACDPKPKK